MIPRDVRGPLAATLLVGLALPAAAWAEEAVPPVPAPERIETASANPAMVGEALSLPAVEGNAAKADAVPGFNSVTSSETSANTANTSHAADTRANDATANTGADDALATNVSTAASQGTGDAPSASAAKAEVPSSISADPGSMPVDPWQSAALVAGLLVALGAGGVALVRLKNRGAFETSRAEKSMQVVGTLALSPKRRLLLVRVKGEEFVVASTEQGVSFLTSVGLPAALPQGATRHNETLAPSGRPRAVAASTPALEQAGWTHASGGDVRAVNASQSERGFDGDRAPRSEAHAPALASPATAAASYGAAGSAGSSPTGAQSEILTSALRKLRERGLRKPGPAQGNETPARANAAPGSRASEPSLPARVGNGSSSTGSAGTGAQGNTAASGGAGTGTFPRYLAKAFAEESRRSIGSGESAGGRDGGEDLQVENVTNLIREKLREMKPLA